MEKVPVLTFKTSPREVIEAFRRVGFAYLEDHGVDLGLQSRLETAGMEFFAQPAAEKNKYAMARSGRAWRGYFPVGGELTGGRPDQKEGFYFGVDHPDTQTEVIDRVPTFGANPWPNQALRAAVVEYMSEMRRVGFRFMALLASGLGLEENFFRKSFGEYPTEFFRIFAYPRHEDHKGHDEWGVREHTDMGFLTILKQDRSGGLQAKGLEGTWLDVPPRENAFVLNIGDMLEFWTGGVLRSTPHRVRNLSERERFSYPYFFDPHWNASLKPIAPGKLTQFSKPERVVKRWDGLELHALSEHSTYGDFVWGKIRHVFPALARD